MIEMFKSGGHWVRFKDYRDLLTDAKEVVRKYGTTCCSHPGCEMCNAMRRLTERVQEAGPLPPPDDGGHTFAEVLGGRGIDNP